MVPEPKGKQLLLSVVYTSSIALVAFSLAIIFLEENVIHTFRDFRVQEPVTSLAEWRWISLDPVNVDTAPTTAIIIAAAFSLMMAIVAFGWVTTLWFGISEEKVSDHTCSLWKTLTYKGANIGDYFLYPNPPWHSAQSRYHDICLRRPIRPRGT